MPTRPIQLGPKWHALQNDLWPGESHGEGGDCANPYCNYEFTTDELEQAEWQNNGQITCPNCGWTQNAMHLVDNNAEIQRERTRAGMTLSEMGALGESVVKQYAEENNGIPGIGALVWEADNYNDPIDIIAGQFALEVKSLHSESFPRFKIAADPATKNRAAVIKAKMDRMTELSQHFGQEFKPGILGVRLNFYTNRADFFFAPDFKDRLMTAMTHLGYTDFTNLNPFKKPEDFAKAQIPAQGETSADDDIPF